MITPTARDGRAASVGALLLRFTLAGAVVTLALALLIGVLARLAGTDEAIRSAERVAQVVAHGVVAPLLTPELVDGQPAAQAALDAAVAPVLATSPVSRVKVWDTAGRVLWSDEPRLTGEVIELGEETRPALREGEVVSGVSDLTDEENRFEPRGTKLLEVYVGVRGRTGEPLIVEVYQAYETVETAAGAAWLRFAPPSVGALLLLQVVQVPFAWRLARRVRAHEEARAVLLRAAVDASEAERRRIAGEVHDGIVQDLTGLTYDLDAARLGRPDADSTRALLERTADQVRHSVSDLRSLLVDLSPPRLPQAGLGPALVVLTDGLRRTGMDVSLDVEEAADLPRPVAELLHRSALEVLRNVASHSGADRVSVAVVRSSGTADLVVEDDGCGFDESAVAESGARGHLGLQALADRLATVGGSLEAVSEPGAGARIVARVPLAVAGTAVPPAAPVVTSRAPSAPVGVAPGSDG